MEATMLSSINRRELLAGAGAATIAARVPSLPAASTFANRRPPQAERCFVSRSVEDEIVRIKGQIANPELAWLFENCYPNTLDTTIEFTENSGVPDTFVITGDIDAMWLRDSSAQLQPYVHLAATDIKLRRLICGALHRQAQCILIDPYANAFMKDPSAQSSLSARTDATVMRPGVAERKWEIDSLCYPMRLAFLYWQSTRDPSPFGSKWVSAMDLAVKTLSEQRRLSGPGPYHFQRKDTSPTETLMFGGYGAPTRKVGLIHSGFRPSDDACTYPFLIPSNLFAVAALRMVAIVLREACSKGAIAARADQLALEVHKAAESHGRMPDGKGNLIWAYEVDGYGNAIFMDDANVPSLSALPLVGAVHKDDAVWRRTADIAWSIRNPYFFQGSAAEGIGGPHAGMDMIWPMSIICRAMLSDDDMTIRSCLNMLQVSNAGTGLMHESFHKNRPATFTRPWFAWANGLFGELIMHLVRNKPGLLT